MKKINITYWIITGLMAAFILLGALMDVSKNAEAVAFIKHLGYPEYFVRFIGVMKILGVITILVQKFPRLKEWAYAGLVFDTFGAVYSHLANGDSAENWFPALLGLALVLGSYFVHRKRCDFTYEK